MREKGERENLFFFMCLVTKEKGVDFSGVLVSPCAHKK